MQATSLPAPSSTVWLWDIFCQVIDNLGDVGVCWRLTADLAARGHAVRLWLDDAQALAWMAPGAREGLWPGVQVRSWDDASAPEVLATLKPAQAWVESFGCDVPAAFVAARASVPRPPAFALSEAPPVWVNLEYLSAEGYVERCHRLPSPVMSGPAKGWTKHFFYPGFTPRTGGLLREPGLLAQRSAFGQVERRSWLQSHGIADQGETLVSLFCYAHAPVDRLLAHLRAAHAPVHLLVTAGQAREAVERALVHLEPKLKGPLRISYLPLLTQSDFDALLWTCDLNFVRGEDSLVRALWAGQPFVWQIYAQDDDAHRIKLEAWLETLAAPPAVRAWHVQWNALAQWDAGLALPLAPAPAGVPPSKPDHPKPWWDFARSAQLQCAQTSDLVSQLCGFVQTCGAADPPNKTR